MRDSLIVSRGIGELWGSLSLFWADLFSDFTEDDAALISGGMWVRLGLVFLAISMDLFSDVAARVRTSYVCDNNLEMDDGV